MASTAPDRGAMIDQRRQAHIERLRIAEDRWARFQAANSERYSDRAKRRLSASLARFLARAKTPGRVLLVRFSGVWDVDLDVSLGSTPGPTSDLGDYVRAGPDASRQPRALFDQSWYLDQNPALADTRWALLAHYLVVGDSHNLSPHPLLDAPAYRARHGAKMSAERLTALEHFLFEGAAQGANPHPLFDVRYYVGQSEEVARSGENPLIHYLRTGWREGLDPHPLFAGAWYLEQNPETQAADVAPLLAYVTKGAAEGIDPHPLFNTALYKKQRHRAIRAEPLADFLASGALTLKNPTSHFDPAYYLEQAGDRVPPNTSPLLHYLTIGAFEGLWPSPDFDEAGYFAAYPQALTSPLSGLEHWARQRMDRSLPAAAGRAVSAETLFSDLRRAGEPDLEAYDSAAYEALRRPRRSAEPREPVSVIAIRRSVTPDWLAVARALPNFHGHLQPRLPADGFTEPADPATLQRDIALAERYRIFGFCHEVASAEQISLISTSAFPFCLAWTGATSASKAVEVLAPALASEHAIRIEGRPVVLVAPDCEPDAWRKAADLFLVQRSGKPLAGFDAHLAQPPPARAAEGPPGAVINPDFRGFVHDQLAVVREHMAHPLEPNAMPLVVAAYDTTPRSQNASTVWQGASPGALQAWVEAASDATRALAPERRLVFVHAWNDWETGAALAPDLRFGHGWLEAIANAADADLLA